METIKINNYDNFVYDISLDNTVVNALGMNVISNTDGFNFKMPNSFRYTEENPYIGKGRGRNVIKDKKYVGVDADVAEFEDLYMFEAYNGGVLKNGLGIDEFCDACIQFSRKNYADLMPDGSIKLVGNTIKSKKMPLYIEKFMDKGIRLLLHGKGKEFIDSYYDYIDKIYNLQIPLKEIATVGKIKTSIEKYKEGCNKLTAAGNKKARQAWYELAIRENLNVNMGDSIYYINIGSKKNESDVKRITKYFIIKDGEKVEITKEYKKIVDKVKKYIKDLSNDVNTNVLEGYEYIKDKIELNKNTKIDKNTFGKLIYGSSFETVDEIFINCILLPNNIIEDEEDHYCDDTFEYNVAKYIEMFNKRIKPLLVCFSEKIRTYTNENGNQVSNILINDPKDRKFFTEKDCELVSGQPFNKHDQDAYEELMSIEDKEISFWIKSDKTPPYVKECNMDWEKIKQNYINEQEKLKEENIKEEVENYKKIIENLTKTELESFINEGVLPEKLLKIVDEDVNSNAFLSRKYKIKIGSIFDIIDKYEEIINEEN